MSVPSGIIDGILKLSGMDKEISERTFYKELRRSAINSRKKERMLPRFFGVKAEKGVYCGMDYYLFTPKETDTSKSIMYLHGSGYVNPIRRAQLSFAVMLARNLHAKIYLPIYPKLPFSTAISCFSLLNNYYAFLEKKGEVFPVGDSSGGALALAIAATHPSVRAVIAISPWVLLDLSEEGREVNGDLMLSVSRLDHTAKLWRGDLPESDLRVSPFYGKYEGKDVFLLAGEKERFRPDVLRFFRELSLRGCSVTYLEGRGGQHCYPLMATAEGQAACEAICLKLRSLLYGE